MIFFKQVSINVFFSPQSGFLVFWRPRILIFQSIRFLMSLSFWCFTVPDMSRYKCFGIYLPSLL